MADFNLAIRKTLVNEGGFSNIPEDHGGPTKYGITQADMPGVDIESLTEQHAIQYYTEHYWKQNYSAINDQNIANKLFDMGVLFGVGEAAYLMQRALSMAPAQWTKTIDQNTLDRINASDSDVLLSEYKFHLTAHAKNLAAFDTTQQTFLTGWLNRINS